MTFLPDVQLSAAPLMDYGRRPDELPNAMSGPAHESCGGGRTGTQPSPRPCHAARRTGLDEDVYQHFLKMPGAQRLAHNTALTVHMLMDQARRARHYRVHRGPASGGRHGPRGSPASDRVLQGRGLPGRVDAPWRAPACVAVQQARMSVGAPARNQRAHASIGASVHGRRMTKWSPEARELWQSRHPRGKGND